MNVSPKIGQPRFLSKAEVLTLHRVAISAYGGAHGLLDEGRLDAALAMPSQTVGGQPAHLFPFTMAAAYGFHLAFAHAFRDGNKRVAFASMVAFLRMNGFNLDLPDEQGAQLILDLITNRRDKLWLAEHLSRTARGRTSWELRDFFASLTYARLHEKVASALAGSQPERAASMREAAIAIPCIQEALIGAVAANARGDLESAAILTQHAILLTSLVRMAEDMDYEW